MMFRGICYFFLLTGALRGEIGCEGIIANS